MDVEDELHDSRMIGLVVRGLRFIYLAAISIHTQSCVWYALACYNTSYSTTATTMQPNTTVQQCRNGSWASDPSIVAVMGESLSIAIEELS